MSARRTSISSRLTWMNLLVSGTALLVASVVLVVYDFVRFRETIVRELSTQAQIIGTNSVSALVFADPETARVTLGALKAAQNIVYAAIYATDDRMFAEYHREASIAPPPLLVIPPGQIESHAFSGGDILLARRITFEGKPTGTVFLRSDSQEIIGRLQGNLLILSIVFALSMFAAVVVSAVSQRAITRPIVDLAETARRVSHDRDYSVRAAPAAGHELGLLVGAFNDMLWQIEQHNARVRETQAELEVRVQRRTAELAAANKELEAFSYSVSHDLRAPLRSIDGFSQVLLEDYGDKLDEPGKDSLQRVRTAATRMTALIDALLALSGVSRAELRTDRVDLSALAQMIAIELRRAEPAREVDVEIQSGMAIDGDTRLLRAALENLFGNAWKFTRRTEGARIEFGCVHQGTEKVYFVRDNGVGFDMTYVNKLFGAFQRLHDARQFSGTGVGLATVQRIIHRHGGRTWADGKVNQGATFYFTVGDDVVVDEVSTSRGQPALTAAVGDRRNS